MRTYGWMSLLLAVGVTVGLCAGAFAADTAACPASQADKSCPAAKPADAPKAKTAEKPKTEVKCEVTGKLAEKSVKNKQGKEVKVYLLTIAEAKAADGKCMESMKGKTVRLSGKKGLKPADFVGKDVAVSGKLVNEKRLLAESIK